MECRLSKVKCSGGDLCARCKRLGKECYYKSHKRGRKSDSSKIQKLERTVDSLSRALEQFSKNKVAGSPSSSQTPFKDASVESKRAMQEASSPDALWKGAEPARPSGASSSSAMSPPARSPRPSAVSSAYSNRRPSELARHRSTSSSWHATHSIASATPTSDDPDEPENLGLPTLSNPLKLLAQASDTARDRDIGTEASETVSTTDPKASATAATAANGVAGSARPGSRSERAEPGSSATAPSPVAKGELQERSGQASLFGVYSGTSAPNTVSRFGPGRGKAFFDIGLFSTKQDNLPHFDPIDRGYLTLAEAESLYELYMKHINPMITLLDPHLHTFEYVRSHSALLLSSTCWIAAKYRVEASQIAADLEMHIRSNLLPTILMDGFRNAEIPQAFIILAAYHPQMNTLSEDKAWAYVGFAIRIASELDMNSRISARPPNRLDDAGLARRLRNRERTWLNLWLFETSMSQHMGRRPTLANDPVVMGCAHWHLDKFALPQDKAMVAVVQLRLIMLRNTELFENFVDGSVSHLPAELTSKQVELFRKICASDLDTWLATWTGPAQHLASQNMQGSASSSSNDPQASSEAGDTIGTGADTSKPKPWPTTNRAPTTSRIQRLKLYYWYARLLLDTIALKCSHLGLDVLRPIYKDAYACSMAYLGLFVATMVPNGLFWGHNSTVVTPVYCAIFALRIVGLSSTSAGAASLQVKSQPKKGNKTTEEDLGIDIDAEYTFAMVEKVAKVCEEAGNATPHRRGAAGSYAFFLFTVLAKAKGAWNAKLARRDVDSGRNGKKREREGNDDDAGEHTKPAKNVKAGNADKKSAAQIAGEGQSGSDKAQRNGGASPEQDDDSSNKASSMQDGSNPTGIDSDHHFLRQLMQFQAGFSGVQTAILNNPSPSHPYSHPTPLHHHHHHHHHHQQQHQHHHQFLQTSNVFPAHFDGVVGQDILPSPSGGYGANGGGGGADGGVEAAGGSGDAGDGSGAGGVVGANGVVDIDWDFGMLDGFLGESLFSDMSFISATPAATGNGHGNGSGHGS